MTNITSVSPKGQVTIPKFIRHQLGIKSGIKIRFKVEPKTNGFVGQIATKSIVDELYGSLKTKRRNYTFKQEREAAKKYVVKRYLKKLARS